MNIHFPQVERKSQLFSYLLAAFATFTVLMLALSMTRLVEVRLSAPTVSIQAVQPENSDAPISIPAPKPPAEQAQSISTPEPVGNVPASLPPLAIPAPAPSVP